MIHDPHIEEAVARISEDERLVDVAEQLEVEQGAEQVEHEPGYRKDAMVLSRHGVRIAVCPCDTSNQYSLPRSRC